MSTCYHCGREWPAGQAVQRSSECPGCRRDVRVCRNCRHYSPGSHWDCRESVGDQVADKERANFCDWFKFAEARPAAPDGADRAGQARRGFASLFGDGDD